MNDIERLWNILQIEENERSNFLNTRPSMLTDNSLSYV